MITTLLLQATPPSQADVNLHPACTHPAPYPALNVAGRSYPAPYPAPYYPAPTVAG